MTKTYSSKMKLLSESDDELIDQFAYNWPILDTFAGGMIVADGTTPPDSELYHGALVREQTTGISWLAYRDPVSGTFTKKWLTYPWQAFGFTETVIGASHPHTFTATPVSHAPSYNSSVNSSAADFPGGRIQPPIPGIYKAVLNTRWLDSSSDEYFQSAAFLIDENMGWIFNNMDTKRMDANIGTNHVTQVYKAPVAPTGNAVLAGISQNSGNPAMRVRLYMSLTLVTPL
jgi:hypothetical protein